MKGLVEVMCREAEYDENSGMVSWRLDTPEGERLAMYHVSDLASAINLRGQPTPGDWHSFCNMMRGKKFKIKFEDTQ
jgi:hypothetical protein